MIRDPEVEKFKGNVFTGITDARTDSTSIKRCVTLGKEKHWYISLDKNLQ